MRAFAAASLGALAIASAHAAGASPSASVCGKLLRPASGAYFGAFTDFNTPREFSEDHVSTAKIDRFEQLAGRAPVWIYLAQHWYKGLGFPRAKVLTIWRHGQIPYIVFQPDSGALYGPGRPQRFPEERFSLQRILDGQFDPQLRAWADAARDTEIPILLEFGTEVNDDWGPWNGKWNGAGESDGYGDPAVPDGAERFRDTFRHFVTLFRDEGATNVTWFFHADSYRQAEWWNQLAWYFPGDSYVDWVGISDYGSLASNQPILGFVEKMASSGVYDDLDALTTRPMGIVEMGVVDNSTRAKPPWIRDAFSALRSGRFPRLRSAVWWQTNSPPNDTRIDSSPEALAAFREAIADPFFGAKPRFSGNCLPAAPGDVTSARGVVSWEPVPNATSYEVWRKGRLMGTTERTRLVAREPGPYAVRGVNPLGKGRFGRT